MSHFSRWPSRKIALPLVFFALSCSAPGPLESPAPQPSSDDHTTLTGLSEAVEDEEAAWRRAKVAKRLENGEVVVAKFEGEFVSAGQPSETTEVVPLDLLDVAYVVEVRLSKLVEGRLPKGWSSENRFGVHSPAIFFGMRGLDGGEEQVPTGTFLFTLWR